MTICNYCGKEIQGKPKKVGPRLRYCDNRFCYPADCLTKHSGTALADGIARIYPDVVEKLRKGGVYENGMDFV